MRNRETWAVTAIHADGALTVNQERGHGTVCLRVDYVREHVRLGYAATEHGYESATVTAGIELASTATTRRGLYVGVTRGRDENLICVITESNDVAEARDVLDGILAVDRADIPAVTQRRNLAVRHPSTPTPPSSTSCQPGRCQIPDWFTSVLAEARHALTDAERTVEARAGDRARRIAVITTAEGELADVDRATAVHREMLAVDAKRADRARREHTTAERRLAGGGPRHRPRRTAPSTRQRPPDLGWHSRHRPARRQPSTAGAAAHRNRGRAVGRRRPSRQAGHSASGVASLQAACIRRLDENVLIRLSSPARVSGALSDRSCAG